jgi:hypothetical protein
MNNVSDMIDIDDSLFYPFIRRRESYSTKSDGKCYQYLHYHNEISEDCKNRCVYCDIKIDEIGFEGMVLDHFRPQKHFQSLVDTPENLVLSCPKCNRLKSDLWPVGTECADTYDGQCGFIDPFIEHMREYFIVHDDGVLTAVKPPAMYLEKVLYLNRNARKQVRHLRILKHKFEMLFSEMESEFDANFTAWTKGKLSKDEFSKFCKEHQRKLNIIRQFNTVDQ